MSRNKVIENLIDIGEKQMFIEKNYDEAEKILMAARAIDPTYRTTYIDHLINVCRRRIKANHEETLTTLKDNETKITDVNSRGDYVSRGNSERGEALYSEILGQGNLEYDKHLFRESAKSNKGSELKPKENVQMFLRNQEKGTDARLHTCYRKYKEGERDESYPFYETEHTSFVKTNENCEGNEKTKTQSTDVNIDSNVEKHNKGYFKKAGRIHHGENKRTSFEEDIESGNLSEPRQEREEPANSYNTNYTLRYENYKECEGKNQLSDMEIELKSDNGYEQKTAPKSNVYGDYGVTELKYTRIVSEIKDECPKNYIHNKYTDKPLTVLDEYEIEILSNSLKMRTHVLCMGIKVFGSKPDYRPDVNFQTVSLYIDDYILRARNAFILKKYSDCESYISEAEKLYSDVAIVLPQASISKHTVGKPKRDKIYSDTHKDSVTSTESNLKSVSYKEFVKGDNIDVIKCLKLAENALNAEDFKRAERLILKSERICATKNARELFKKLEAAQKKAAEMETAKAAVLAAVKNANIDVQEIVNLAAQEVIEVTALEAEKSVNIVQQQIKGEELANYPTKKSVDINKEKQAIANNNHKTGVNFNEQEKNFSHDKPAAEQCMLKAKDAFDNNDFAKADRLLLKAKRMDPEVDILPLQSKIRMATASRSSSDTQNSLETEDGEQFFQPTHDKKLNSKKCLKLARDFLHNGHFSNAKKYLFKAKNYYNSNQVKEMFDHFRQLENTNITPQPSFDNAGQENVLSTGCSNEVDEVEKYLRKARFALTNLNFEEAEEFALKCDSLAPVRAKGLLQDIKKVKEMRKEFCNRKSTGNNDKETAHGRVVKNDEELNTFDEIECSEFTNEIINKDKSNNFSPRRRNDIENLDACNKDNFEPQPEINSYIRKDTTDAVDNCIIKAQKAYLTKNLDLAEHFLQKAYRLYPDEKTLDLLHKIRMEIEVKNGENTEKMEADSENTQSGKPPRIHQNVDFQKCLKMAENAYEEKDFDKADRLFTKADRMNPSNYTKDFMKKVRYEKSLIIKNNNENPIEEDTPEKALIKSLVEEFTRSAFDAVDSRCYHVAEKNLEKAKYLSPNDTTTEILQQLQEFILNQRKQKKIQKTDVEEEKLFELENEAKKYLKMAEVELHRGNLESAQSFALISDSFSSSELTRKLFKDIFNEKYRIEKGYSAVKQKKIKPTMEKNCFKSERYVEIAEKVLMHGDFKLAEEYLIESNKIYHTSQAAIMLKKVRAAINDAKQKPDCPKTWFQQGVNWVLRR